MPNFAKIVDKTLFLKDRNLTDSQIDALAYVIGKTKNYIEKLVLDNNQMTDR